jgi:hypothetical protein
VNPRVSCEFVAKRGSTEVSHAHGYHFPHEIEPSAIQVAPVLNRPVLEHLALFVRIDAELIKQRSERIRIDQISLSHEILADDASALFSEAVF